MWRYLVGAGGMAAAIGAGVLLFSNRATPSSVLPAMPAAVTGEVEPQTLPDAAPEASPKTREQKRFGRYDKDKDGAITRDEYLQARRKAFAKLDTNGDGRLAFDEWATKAIGKFSSADRDGSGAMNAAEFATTAVKRKAPRRVNCPPQQAQAQTDDQEG